MVIRFSVGNSSAKGPDIEGSAEGDVDIKINELVRELLILAGCSGGQKFSDKDTDTEGSANEDKYLIIEEMIYLIEVIYPDMLIPGV